MSQTMATSTCEKQLLDSVEMLYNVAYGMTRDPWTAEYITRVTMLEAWKRRDAWGQGVSLKAALLKLLRENFVKRQRAAQRSAKQDALGGPSRGHDQDSPRPGRDASIMKCCTVICGSN